MGTAITGGPRARLLVSVMHTGRRGNGEAMSPPKSPIPALDRDSSVLPDRSPLERGRHRRGPPVLTARSPATPVAQPTGNSEISQRTLRPILMEDNDSIQIFVNFSAHLLTSLSLSASARSIGGASDAQDDFRLPTVRQLVVRGAGVDLGSFPASNAAL